MKINKTNTVIICVLAIIIGLVIYNCSRTNTDTDMTSHENSINNTILSTNIRFSYEYVGTIVCNSVDTTYHVKYDDPDAFDYDNLAHYAGIDEWYGDYIFVHIDKGATTAFLHDYIVYTSDVTNDTKTYLNKKYYINEVEVIDTNNISTFTWTIKIRE